MTERVQSRKLFGKQVVFNIYRTKSIACVMGEHSAMGDR